MLASRVVLRRPSTRGAPAHAWRPTRWLIAFAVLVLPSAVFADRADIDAIRAGKRVTAVRITEPIHLDGVLDEAAWQRADPAKDFYQQQPDEFNPAVHRTEVRFLYDDENLYIGAELHDETADRLITNDLKRDFSGRETDTFGLNLDSRRGLVPGVRHLVHAAAFPGSSRAGMGAQPAAHRPIRQRDRDVVAGSASVLSLQRRVRGDADRRGGYRQKPESADQAIRHGTARIWR